MPRLTAALRAEYQTLFDSCTVSGEHRPQIQRIVSRMLAARQRYDAVALPLRIPWCIAGVIHVLEAAQNFNCHLHNGDPLGQRTVRVPRGRPVAGTPPFTWEQSARDALTLAGWPVWKDWSMPGVLYKLEAYNGWGYRSHHPEVRSPYLWSCSNHYSAGKYVADGVWSATAVSRQVGAAPILRMLGEVGEGPLFSVSTAPPSDPPRPAGRTDARR